MPDGDGDGDGLGLHEQELEVEVGFGNVLVHEHWGGGMELLWLWLDCPSSFRTGSSLSLLPLDMTILPEKRDLGMETLDSTSPYRCALP